MSQVDKVNTKSGGRSGDESGEDGLNNTIVAGSSGTKQTVGTKRLTEEQIDAMKVCELKKELKKMGLSVIGKKQRLRERLKQTLEEDESEEETEESEDENNEDDDIPETTIDKKTGKGQRNIPRAQTQKATSFTINDVEESLKYFTGDDGLQIHRWLSDFEDTSMLLGWNDLQKFVYGKRMLRGSAREFITFERNVTSWDDLKSRLLAEFKVAVNPATIHSQLYRRRQQSDETSRKYVYSMQKIADQGVIEESALIRYIADGVQGDAQNKIFLFKSKTLSELKENLDVYDEIRERTAQKHRFKKESTSNKDRKTLTPKKVHCYGCGSSEHDVKACPNREKGPKCFRCNKFGHIAPNCDKENRTESSVSKVGCIHSTEDKILVEINGVSSYALLDNGSEVNIISTRMYNEIDRPKLYGSTRVFVGLGRVHTKPIGQFKAEVTIGGDKYETNVFVMNEHETTDKVIIGRELLRQLDVRFNKGEVTIRRAQLQEEPIEVTNVSNDSKIEDDTEKQPEDTEAGEIMKINYIEEGELDVSREYKGKIHQLIRDYRPVDKVKTTIKTKIIIKGDEPICSQPRRLAPKERNVLARQISEWLDDGVIQQSTSEFSSPVVIVPKKDGSHRICIDYRKLNARMVRDRFPMPLIEDCIDGLADSRVFSVIDLKSGFFHVPVAEQSRKFTAFVTQDGQYEFLKTPFGLCNSPTSFLRFIDEIFKDLIRRKVVITYMDDVIIPGRDMEDAFNNLKETLKVAATNGLQINWDKCKFLQESVEFLGHLICNGHIHPSPTKIKAVQRYPEPKSKKQIQSFLGLTGYFRKFVKDYARIARPLSDVLKNDSTFSFGIEQRKSFMLLKEALSKRPVLRIFSPQARTELHTDASKEGFGAILLQKADDEKHFHPVFYMSRKTSDAEKKYNSYELEVLAAVRAVQKFRVYLLGVKFKLITDCQAFQKTLQKKDLPPKIARWALSLEEFDYEVEHRTGDKLKHVDALSRYPVMLVEDKLIQMIRRKQQEEERLNVIRQLLEKEPYENYLIENDLLMKRVDGRNVIVLPVSMQTDIIRRTHENGHFAAKKIVEKLKEEFYIPGLSEKIDKIISCCVPCILAERKKGKKESKLNPIPKGDRPLATFHIDHLGPMTATSKLYKYILVVVDSFSKFVWLYPTKTTNTKEVLDKLKLQQKTFGNPERIITDKGTAFTSTEFNSYCESEGIEHISITTGIPRGNGQVERINRIIIPVLTKLSIDLPEKWYLHVNKVQRCINSTHQRSVGMTPFEVMFGIKMRHREDHNILSVIEEEAAEQFVNDRTELRQIAKQNLLKIQEENRRNYNRDRKEATIYKEGDLVAIKRTQFGPGLKVHKKFLGPYKVSTVKRNNRYEVIRVGNHEGPKITSTAADYMKPYYEYSSETEESAGMAECGEPGSRP